MAYIGMRSPKFWPISTRTDGSAISYGNPVDIGPAVSANVTFDVTDNPDYGDDVIIDNDKGINGYTIALETNDVALSARGSVLGWVAKMSTATTPALEYYDVTGATPPEGGGEDEHGDDAGAGVLRRDRRDTAGGRLQLHPREDVPRRAEVRGVLLPCAAVQRRRRERQHAAEADPVEPSVPERDGHRLLPGQLRRHQVLPVHGVRERKRGEHLAEQHGRVYAAQQQRLMTDGHPGSGVPFPHS